LHQPLPASFGNTANFELYDSERPDNTKPMEKESIYEISQRANINHKITSTNNVVIYEDHRTILNVLFHLKEKRKIEEPLDLVMFDNHDDFCHPRPAALKKLSSFLKKPTKEKLNQIVEFDLSSLDDDWVKFGMELGLIGNVFLFNSDESNVHFREEYETKKNGTKYLYNLGDVWSALGYHGLLNDPIKSEYKQLLTDFGWELVEGKYRFSQNRKKYVFDIDLDCFSTRILDKTIAIPEDIIIKRLTKFSHPSYHYYYSSQNFMKDLIKDSELVTLCFENGCCGGIREAHKIFNMVDYILFDNELGES
jgi:hypothetical protein